MSARHVLGCTLFALSLLPAAFSQLEPGSVPVSLGPLGGSAGSILVDPLDADVILVIQYTKGLMRSADAGVTFEPFGAGLSANASDLAQVPGEVHGLYAIDGTRIVRSADFGATWTTLPLVADESLKGLALPATGSTVLAYDAFNIHRSANGGLSWTTTATLVPFAGEIFDSLALSADGGTAYAGSFHGVRKSSNGGASFAPVGGAFSQWVQCLTVSPTDPDVVFLGTPFNGMFRSTNGGASFDPIVSAVTAGNGEFFAWEGGGARLWYATLTSLVQTTDGGATWFDATDGWPESTPIPTALALPATGPRYFGCEGGGLYDQAGGGLYVMPAGAPTSWQHLGFLVSHINAVAITSPGGPRVIGIGSGVYAGESGEILTPTAWHYDLGTDTRAIAVDPTDATRWLTGGVGSFQDNAQIVVLTDGGQSFSKVYETYGAGSVQDIAFDPGNPQRVIAGMSPAAFGTKALIRSLDGGNTWTDVAGTSGWATRAVAWDPHVPGRVLQLSDNNQWAQSLNAGLTWSTLQPALTNAGPAVLLEFDPFAPGVAYRGDSGSGLWRTDNGGGSWHSLGVSLHADSELLLHPQQPGLLWVSDADGSVLVSGNRGDSFEVALDMPLDANATALALDTSDGSLLIGSASASTWELAHASPVVVLGGGTPGTGGLTPRATLSGGLPLLGNAAFGFRGEGFVGGSLVYLALSAVDTPLTAFGGTFHVGGQVLWLTYPSGGTAGAAGAGAFTATLPLANSPVLANIVLVAQMATKDTGAAHPSNVVLSNALTVTLLP